MERGRDFSLKKKKKKKKRKKNLEPNIRVKGNKEISTPPPCIHSSAWPTEGRGSRSAPSIFEGENRLGKQPLGREKSRNAGCASSV